MSLLLALAAAASIGFGDLAGGVASRRGGPLPVVLLSRLVGGGAVGLALIVFRMWRPGPEDILFGALAGLCGVVGLGLLYHGLATGAMGQVAPLAAVVATLLPVILGILDGEQPSALASAGMALALPGLWLTSASFTDQSLP